MTDRDSERLELARWALVDTGYFTPEEVDLDVAPRITEFASAVREGKWPPVEPTSDLEPGVVPTPAQWVNRFLTMDRATQERVAAGILHNTETASRCFVMNHDGRLEQAEAELRRYRRDEERRLADATRGLRL